MEKLNWLRASVIFWRQKPRLKPHSLTTTLCAPYCARTLKITKISKHCSKTNSTLSATICSLTRTDSLISNILRSRLMSWPRMTYLTWESYWRSVLPTASIWWMKNTFRSWRSLTRSVVWCMQVKNATQHKFSRASGQHCLWWREFWAESPIKPKTSFASWCSSALQTKSRHSWVCKKRTQKSCWDIRGSCPRPMRSRTLSKIIVRYACRSRICSRWQLTAASLRGRTWTRTWARTFSRSK